MQERMRDMLDFPIVDSHLHIWNLNRLRYPWLDQIPELNKNCLMMEFDAARGAYAVDKIVFMQAECSHGQYMDEVQFVEEVAREDARLKAIVAWAPMEVEGENLRALEQLAGRPLVKGIRRLIQTEDSESFCRIPALTQALRRLPELGLTFDLGIHTGQFYDVVRLAEACPETRFVVDHLGKPDIRGGRLAEWKEEMRALCQCENVWCKVSSLATEADHHHWTLEEVRPYAEWAFECFGFRRVMFGGDWPVSSQAASYPICVETLLTILQGATEAEKRAFFRENAEQFYGI